MATLTLLRQPLKSGGVFRNASEDSFINRINSSEFSNLDRLN